MLNSHISESDGQARDFHQSVNKVCKPTEVAERKTNPDKCSFMSFFLKWEGQEWESQKLKRKTKGRIEKMRPAKTETSV